MTRTKIETTWQKAPTFHFDIWEVDLLLWAYQKVINPKKCPTLMFPPMMSTYRKMTRKKCLNWYQTHRRFHKMARKKCLKWSQSQRSTSSLQSHKIRPTWTSNWSKTKLKSEPQNLKRMPASPPKEIEKKMVVVWSQSTSMSKSHQNRGPPTDNSSTTQRHTRFLRDPLARRWGNITKW